MHICPLDIPVGATSFLEWGVMGGTSGVPSPPTATIETSASTKNPGMVLETSGVTNSVAGTTTTVTGTVANGTGAPIKYAGVCAAVYDGSGNVVAGDYTVPTLPGGTLASGGSVNFSVRVVGTTGVSVKTVAVGYAQ